MSASNIDRLLRVPRSATRLKKARRAMPAAHRRVPVRTFADWNEPPPGSMEMDLVAHCGETNRGSYVNSLRLDRGCASGGSGKRHIRGGVRFGVYKISAEEQDVRGLADRFINQT